MPWFPRHWHPELGHHGREQRGHEEREVWDGNHAGVFTTHHRIAMTIKSRLAWSHFHDWFYILFRQHMPLFTALRRATPTASTATPLPSSLLWFSVKFLNTYHICSERESLSFLRINGWCPSQERRQDRTGNLGHDVLQGHHSWQEGRGTGFSTHSRSVSGDCSIAGGPACVLPLPGRFKNSFHSQGRGGQGENEDKWTFAGKLQAVHLPRLNLEWRVSCFYCASCLKNNLSVQGQLWALSGKDPTVSRKGPVYSLDQQPGGHWQSLQRKKKHSVLRFRRTSAYARTKGFASQALWTQQAYRAGPETWDWAGLKASDIVINSSDQEFPFWGSI